MTAKDYNGWTNYETWLVALWIDNEPGSYDDRCAAAEDAWTDAEDAPNQSDAARYALADWLKDYVQELVPDGLPGFIADLVEGALSEVDWHEIADNWLSEQDEYEARS